MELVHGKEVRSQSQVTADQDLKPGAQDSWMGVLGTVVFSAIVWFNLPMPPQSKSWSCFPEAHLIALAHSQCVRNEPAPPCSPPGKAHPCPPVSSLLVPSSLLELGGRARPETEKVPGATFFS